MTFSTSCTTIECFCPGDKPECSQSIVIICLTTLMSSPTTNARTQLIAGIELFLAIQRHRSISKAAWALGITQSAASKQLKALETLAGAPLFIRTTRSLKLSDTGRALLEGSRDLVQSTDKLLEILQESSGRCSNDRRARSATHQCVQTCWLYLERRGWSCKAVDRHTLKTMKAIGFSTYGFQFLSLCRQVQTTM